MSPILIGVLGVVVMLFLMFLGTPIALSMAIPGLLGVAFLRGFDVALPQLHLQFYHITHNYQLTVLPFFILMGYFASDSGITSDLYTSAEKWLGKLPGGLCLATIAGCAGFAAICGSSSATAAAMATVALPEMRKRGYDLGLASGTIAAGGTLGFLIPPSAAFVIYGIITEESVGKLLIAGFVPGFILAMAFMAIIIMRVKFNPKLAPSGGTKITWKQRLSSLKDIWAVIVVFVLVMGGIYMGLFTTTEAGAAGAFILFIFVILRRKLTLKILFSSLLGTAKLSCMIFFIIYGAYLFNDALSLSQLPVAMASAIDSMQVSKYVVLAMIVLLYIVLGCIIEPIPMILLTMPMILPIITRLGFSPIWFGVVIVMLIEAALITPPVGNNIFILAGVAKDIPVMTIYKGSQAFLISILVVIAIITAVPQIALFLPALMSR